MARHHGGERVEFEIKIGVTGGDHFVVNEFVFGAEMAFETFFRAVNDVSRLVHAELDGPFMRPAGGSVRPEPARGRTVAILAGDAFCDFELAALLLGFCVERVAHEAFGRFFRFRAELEDARHALTDIAGESLVGAAVLVLQNPGGVFGLENAAAGDGADAAVATRSGARAGTDVFHRFSRGIFRLCAKRSRKQRKISPRNGN